MPTTPQQGGALAAVELLADRFRAVVPQVTEVAYRRWRWFEAFREAGGLELAPVSSSKNRRQDLEVERFAKLIAGLRADRLELVGYRPSRDEPITLAVREASGLGFPVVGVILVGGAVLAANIIAAAMLLEEQSERLDAENRQRATEALADADPDDRAALADAIRSANEAATRRPSRGWLERMAGAVGSAARSSTGPLIAAAVLYWLWQGRGGRRA